MIPLSPVAVEMVPVVAALLIGAAGWSLALYTRHISRRERAKRP